MRDVNDYHRNWHWNKISQWPGIDIEIQGLKPCSPHHGHGYIITLWLTAAIPILSVVIDADTWPQHSFDTHFSIERMGKSVEHGDLIVFVLPFIILSLVLMRICSVYVMFLFSCVLCASFVRFCSTIDKHTRLSLQNGRIYCVWKRRDNRELIAIKFIIWKRATDGCVCALDRE